jgi:hypothetical protein
MPTIKWEMVRCSDLAGVGGGCRPSRRKRRRRGRVKKAKRQCRRATEKANELTSPHIRTQAQEASIVSAQTSTLTGDETGIETICRGAQPMSMMDFGQGDAARDFVPVRF